MQFALEGESYENSYHRLYNGPDLKKQFQLRWTEIVNSTKEVILLIDTVQNYYHLETKKFFHHCFPLNFINASSHGKAPKIEFPPKKWLGYPIIMTESIEGDWQMEFA
ncbi:hypothetical protein AVEN_144746-1 [Araneus ventricosus]|uniref:Uncharacterized protein n=1 Tax=Araneus ventricosus TaxID=182803 RepID=A0A4Y2C4L7_ARAVE|nr:hypothetical protein AVEN_144746-1 [Araneus ventricosus]